MPSDPSDPLWATAAGLRVAVRVQPGASRTGIDGLKTLDDGQVVLAVRVNAAPEGGKANAALVKLLAKTWKLPKRTIEIVAGHGARRKIVHIDGDPAALQAHLEAWLAGIAKADSDVGIAATDAGFATARPARGAHTAPQTRDMG